MLLTFLIDPPFLLFLGYLFAFALPLTATTPIIRSRALKAGLATVTIFNIAVVISYLYYPDWMWMYLFETAPWPRSLLIVSAALGIVGYYLLFILGFFWGLRQRRRRGTWAIGIALLLASGAIIIPVFDQYFHVGTLAEYLAGTAQPLPASPLGSLYNISLSAILIAGFLLFRWARRER